MSIQTLTPPQDITWTRLAFSRDMIDTNFGDLAFSPKWRSSMAVYYYIVPDEETADAYPNSRIVYLKVTCSITGWNPSETLNDVKQAAEEAGTWDDLQRTLWEVIISSGWASTYWPCLGAIVQLAVYPNNPANVAPDDYPYILDFEPKKRELFESVTEGSEFLSGSSEGTSISKGSTSVKGLEYGGGGSFSIGGFGASASVSRSTSDTTVNENTTDTLREARETLSRTTSSSQMYQLFNGYHLGSNRALFVIAPRPHTVSGASHTEFNLIDGERKLEGIQEMFVVVHMPRHLDGFCTQAGLDTGHQATTAVPYMVMRRPVDHQPNGGPEPDPFPPDPPDPPPDTPVKQLIITRRVAQSCGTFDENGNFHVRAVREPRRPLIHGEIAISDVSSRATFRSLGAEGAPSARVRAANARNAMQSRVTRSMLDSASSVGYVPRDFVETSAFKSLVAHTARAAKTPLTRLVEAGYLDAEEARAVRARKITTLGDLFDTALAGTDREVTQSVRAQVIDKLLADRPRG